jgi:hypothetical protein
MCRGHDDGETVSLNSSWPGIKPFVMAGLVPAIHVLPVLKIVREDVDARHKAGHDE